MQIDEPTIELIKAHRFTLAKSKAVHDEFGTCLSKVVYKNLWKPLYCDLVARLWIDMQVCIHVHNWGRQLELGSIFWYCWFLSQKVLKTRVVFDHMPGLQS